MSNQVVDRHPVTTPPRRPVECCPEVPELRRLQYFYGQMLSGADLQEEQRYFREKLKLLNRCVNGYGVLCGLRVVPEPDEEPCDPDTNRTRKGLEAELDEREQAIVELRAQLEQAGEEKKAPLEEALRTAEAGREDRLRRLDELCPPDDRKPPSARVTIECGIAIDCEGREIIVRRPATIDLYDHLEPADRRRLREDRRRRVWISICFCESPVEPVRPVYSDSCKPAEACRHAKILESYRIRVSLDPPAADGRCEPCCCACGDACLVLARIDRVLPGRPIPEGAVRNDVRRRFGLYDWATVTGINWVHGGYYSADQAAHLLGRNGRHRGLEFRFSRGVRAETLQEGVIDVWVIEGGRGRSGGIYNVPGRITHPPGPLVDRVYFRQESDDKFHHGDRLSIKLRGDFVLDECCRPIDGNHIGGRVPLIAGSYDIEHPRPRHSECLELPNWYGPWRSGNGEDGGLFESWVTIRDRDYRPDYPDEPGYGDKGQERPDHPDPRGSDYKDRERPDYRRSERREHKGDQP